MRVLSIIPARGGSKGIPLKNLVMLNQKPLLYYTVTASLKSKIINKTVVSTDNKKIGKVALNLGAEVVYRPKKLATDTTSLEPVIEHVLNYLNTHDGYNPEIIVILQNTSPLRTTKHIDEALTLMKKQNYDSILSGFSIHTFLWKKSKKTRKWCGKRYDDKWVPKGCTRKKVRKKGKKASRSKSDDSGVASPDP